MAPFQKQSQLWLQTVQVPTAWISSVFHDPTCPCISRSNTYPFQDLKPLHWRVGDRKILTASFFAFLALRSHSTLPVQCSFGHPKGPHLYLRSPCSVLESFASPPGPGLSIWLPASVRPPSSPSEPRIHFFCTPPPCLNTSVCSLQCFIALEALSVSASF